ncbi:uncharacterized protein EDB93DRAFT_1339082 [Suillus bovinus]|uniref:uncharacterized protein n=1 Tax=Suillus bovinus TaxID=48563 RepID=UPI001B869D17|nr:uncharacterized protein EDB93DRAFT_1339082 [Suillus bovinus]KAG2138399.1 hypothetical protein EDB93DRAFT_1339082 [Suillus bovinus]
MHTVKCRVTAPRRETESHLEISLHSGASYEDTRYASITVTPIMHPIVIPTVLDRIPSQRPSSHLPKWILLSSRLLQYIPDSRLDWFQFSHSLTPSLLELENGAVLNDTAGDNKDRMVYDVDISPWTLVSDTADATEHYVQRTIVAGTNHHGINSPHTWTPEKLE